MVTVARWASHVLLEGYHVMQYSYHAIMRAFCGPRLHFLGIAMPRNVLPWVEEVSRHACLEIMCRSLAGSISLGQVPLL